LKYLKLSLFLVVLTTFIIGCTSISTPTPSTEEIITSTQNLEAYPISGYPSPEGSEIGYPAFPSFVAESAYPIVTPTKDPKMNGPKFEINKPVFGGSKVVTGTGPANVPIILIDVTEMGTFLGQTTIDENGDFIFNLDEELVSYNAIGLQIGDLSETNLNYEDFIYSEDYIDRPLIGIVFDIAPIVQP